MVQNVMCCWWQGTHYSLSEIRTLKIWRRRKSLGYGAAYQLLPRSPTSEIHGLSWKPLLHAPQGVRRSSTMSPRVWRGCHRGGVASDWYCALYSNPPRNRRPTHTNNEETSAFLETVGGLLTNLRFIKDWWSRPSCQKCKSKHYDVEKWWKYHDTRIEHQHCHIFAFDLIVFFWFFFFVCIVL